MTINIHGKQYVTVAERIKMLHDSRDGTRFDISTHIIAETDDTITIKAIVECAAGRFTGHATSKKDAEGAEGDAPLEVAETSAVGRALGFAGFGANESIASADEVQQVRPRQRPQRPPRKTHDELEAEAKEIAKPWACGRCGTGEAIPDSKKNCPKCGHVRGAKADKPAADPPPEVPAGEAAVDAGEGITAGADGDTDVTPRLPE